MASLLSEECISQHDKVFCSVKTLLKTQNVRSFQEIDVYSNKNFTPETFNCPKASLSEGFELSTPDCLSE